MSTGTPPDEPPAAPPAEAPEWAQSLQRTLQELPGKLRASITDDDKSGIAEAVHGLFERSGAFHTEPPPGDADKDEKDAEDDVTKVEHEAPPAKASGPSRFAAWFTGGKE